ncbi:hypothetical protein ACJJIQ_04465 [Microbulbifer sp. ANSA003]|uniref:hypothetical protein n=1 Tax=Microbulbifer sp. ANSA003 TaxID=3243360 RepID=UPI004040FF5D
MTQDGTNNVGVSIQIESSLSTVQILQIGDQNESGISHSLSISDFASSTQFGTGNISRLGQGAGGNNFAIGDQVSELNTVSANQSNSSFN